MKHDKDKLWLLILRVVSIGAASYIILSNIFA